MSSRRSLVSRLLIVIVVLEIGENCVGKGEKKNISMVRSCFALDKNDYSNLVQIDSVCRQVTMDSCTCRHI